MRVYAFICGAILGTCSVALASPPPTDSIRVTLSKKYDLTSPIARWYIHETGSIPTDDERFRDLIETDARKAIKLDAAGIKLGRYIGRTPPSRDTIRFLVSIGVPNANWHIKANLYLVEEGADASGAWFKLVTEDEYWTNRYNRDTYDFAIRIATDGNIWLMNPIHVGENGRSTVSATKKK